MSDPIETPWQGKFLEIRRQGRWEYAARRGDLHAAVILATDGDDVILVEQHRAPLGRRTIELPAGMVGDETEGESVADAAARELEEETGYRARRVELLGEFGSSPGMSAETFTLVRATGLDRVGEGGGDAGEGITVHRVPLGDVPAFLGTKRAEGCGMDAKLLLLLGPTIVEASA